MPVQSNNLIAVRVPFDLSLGTSAEPFQARDATTCLPECYRPVTLTG